MAGIVDIASVRSRPTGGLEPLWRDVLGRRLRTLRLAADEKLVDTAARAGISPQYLSEIERGLKEPSSEMIAAIAGSLGTSLVELTADVTRELRSSPAQIPASRPQQAMLLAA